MPEHVAGKANGRRPRRPVSEAQLQLDLDRVTAEVASLSGDVASFAIELARQRKSVDAVHAQSGRTATTLAHLAERYDEGNRRMGEIERGIGLLLQLAGIREEDLAALNGKAPA